MNVNLEKTIQFITKARIVHRDKYNYSKTQYINNYTKVIITCPIHGDFMVTPNNHLRGNQCPECGRIQRAKSNTKDTTYFINKARYVHKNKYDYSEVNYINSKQKVTIICHNTNEFGKEHGVFLQTPHDHLSGYGCPKCRLLGQMKLFNSLQEIFPKETILFEVNDKVVPWLEGQRFDIYFPKYNIAVEYNGRQHYMPVKRFGGNLGYENTVKRDQLKRDKCNKNNCTLIEIKYKYSKEEFRQLIDTINNVINSN